MIKKIACCFVALTVLVLTGCVDTVEELTINPDGSGVYKNTMDMSGMYDLMEMMAAMDTAANSQFKKMSEKDIDSVFALRSVTDTAARLTPEQKRLFQDATMSITMKQNDKVFRVGMTYPFTKPEDVQKIIELNDAGKGVGLFEKKDGDQAALPGLGDQGQFPSVNDFYIVTIKNGLIERMPNEEKLASLKDNDQFQELKGAEDMMETIAFKTIIHLPKAARKAEGERVELSADKKTVTIKSSLLDLFENPKALGFRIEY